MRRLVGISFVGEEPVRGAFVRFGDVTVLTGRNDSGKTRVLRLIGRVFTAPERAEFVDVFGIASDDEVAALVDPDAPDRFGIEGFVDAVAPWLDAVELAGDADEIRLGVRVDADGSPSAWRFGRAPVEVEPVVRDAILEALPEAAGLGDVEEPVKVEYLGRPELEILPQAITVPSPTYAVAQTLGAAMMSVCRTLQELTAAWMLFQEGSSALEDAPPLSFLHLWPSEPYINGAPSGSWLIEEQRHASVVHPAAVEACAALERIAAGLLADFIADEYRLEITPAQPSDIAHGSFLRLRLMRRDTQLDREDDVDRRGEGGEGEDDADAWLPVEPDDGALRFGLDDAPAGFAVWLQLALYEAAHRARIVSHNLQTGIRHLAHIHRQITDEGRMSAPFYEVEDNDEQAWPEEPDADALDDATQMLQHALGYLRKPTLLPPPSRADRKRPHRALPGLR